MAIYLRELCRAVCHGTLKQAQMDAGDLFYMYMKCSDNANLFSEADVCQVEPELWMGALLG